uniref:Small ribosomal subunit protein uS14c n=1 Tax=Nephroselmis pyriformis TaxID=156128 RepID=A0A8A2H805_9CHLO|nr:ribosomal protein S14 [Nephroselmis pyriformis]QSV37242.1 ribosomal protein S14 [Nephroselmis pyriformis]
MAKKSMIAREVKRAALIQKHNPERQSIKAQIRQEPSLQAKMALHRRLQKLPRNSAPVRLHNRCTMTGRPKGYYRDFGVSRHVLREMAHQCLLPGVTKASW